MLLVEQGREMFVRRPNGSSSVSSDPGERYIRVPEHGVSNSSSYDVSATSALPSPLQPNMAAGGYSSSVFPVSSEVTSSRELVDEIGEAYIRLEDCYSGQPVGTLPLYSAAHSAPTVSPSKASKQVHAGATISVDATNHFNDCARQRVEYCNEYERGEHDSLFVTNCNHTNDGDHKCADSDSNDEDYCHYQYPAVHYGTCCSMQPELSKSSSIREHYFCEPDYVNCSYLFDLHHNVRRKLCPPAKRYGICCEPLLTCPELPKLYEKSSSVCVDTYTSAGWNSCRFVPSTSKAGTAAAAAAAAAADDDDDDDDDLHDYVNVPLLRSRVPFLL